jgi:hypothetical protein
VEHELKEIEDGLAKLHSQSLREGSGKAALLEERLAELRLIIKRTEQEQKAYQQQAKRHAEELVLLEQRKHAMKGSLENISQSILRDEQALAHIRPYVEHITKQKAELEAAILQCQQVPESIDPEYLQLKLRL